jgi:hypothetical protein
MLHKLVGAISRLVIVETPTKENGADPANEQWDAEYDPVWRRPARLGHHEAMKGLGGAVAPFLAGFSLTTIAVVVTTANPPRLATWTVLAFTGAATTLVYSMQVAFLAIEHHATPSDWLAWYPEATVSKRSLANVRRRQAIAYQRVLALQKRYSVFYEIGMICFLAGVGLLVWPQHAISPFWHARWLPVIVVALALLSELLWSATRRVNAHWERTDANKRVRTPWPFLPATQINDDLLNSRSETEPRARQEAETLTALRAAEEWGVAGVLDPDRRRSANLPDGYPDLSNDTER